MKTRWFKYILPALLLSAACSDDKPEADDSHVLVMFMAGYNNLSGNIATNIELELTKGSLPAKGSSNAIVIFSHCSPYAKEGHRYKSTQQYDVPTQPVLIRAYSEGGKAVLDTLMRYPTDFDYTDPDNLNSVLTEIAERFQASRYGLLYSSHGTGWLPADDTVKTRAVGARFHKSQWNMRETDIRDFAAALPVHFDYIIMDACYMGAVEVVYQLRDCCDYMVVSETEIPADGFDYARLPQRLFASDRPNLEQVCNDYMVRTSVGGTVALVRTAGLEDLAEQVSRLGGIPDTLDRAVVQKMGCSGEYRYFYDMQDIFGGRLDLSRVVLMEQHTPEFNAMAPLKIDRCCGLSMYLPLEEDTLINSYYRTLDFCRDAHLPGDRK